MKKKNELLQSDKRRSPGETINECSAYAVHGIYLAFLFYNKILLLQ